MIAIHSPRTAFRSAIARGVRQFVVIGSQPALPEALESSPASGFQVFAVNDAQPLAAALANSAFDKQDASLFVWLGGVGYRTIDAVLTSLAFIASLPKDSGVLLDYPVESTAPGSRAKTALDALSSRISTDKGDVRHLIQPQALAALLRCLGFQNVLDLAHDSSRRLVIASV